MDYSGTKDESRSGNAEDPLKPDEIETKLALAGARISAIKAYRNRTGVSLSEAKDAIDTHFPYLTEAPITKHGRRQWGASLTELGHNVELVDAIEEAIQQSGYLEGDEEPEEEEVEQE